MKKHYVMISMLLIVTSQLFALTDAEAKKKEIEILQALVNGHNFAFGQGNLLKASLNLNAWNQAFAEMKNFVTTIINEHKNALGIKDATLANVLEKITKAETDLVATIKASHDVLNSPADLVKQIEKLTKIINDMLAVQKSLTMQSSSPAKNEAQKILNSSAMFIETTATKARKDANAAYNPPIPANLPPTLPR